MDDLIEELNYNCNYNMFLVRILLPDLKTIEGKDVLKMLTFVKCRVVNGACLAYEFVAPLDLLIYFVYVIQSREIALGQLRFIGKRTLVMKWINKLTLYNKDVPAMRMRNEFMYNLVLHMQSGKLAMPFTSEPPTDIASVLHYLSDKDPQKERPMIYQNSPDGGAFLAAQPVPRSGAFCYLAVVSKGD